MLSELRLLGMQGPELVEQLAGERASFPLVLIANNADTPKAVKAGVDFVCGPLLAKILITTIQRVNTGNSTFVATNFSSEATSSD